MITSECFASSTQNKKIANNERSLLHAKKRRFEVEFLPVTEGVQFGPEVNESHANCVVTDRIIYHRASGDIWSRMGGKSGVV